MLGGLSLGDHGHDPVGGVVVVQAHLGEAAAGAGQYRAGTRGHFRDLLS